MMTVGKLVSQSMRVTPQVMMTVDNLLSQKSSHHAKMHQALPAAQMMNSPQMKNTEKTSAYGT